MNLPLDDRRRAPLTVASVMLGFLATSSSGAGSLPVPTLFDGGSFGSTVDLAIQGAIEDAANTASIYGLYNCRLVGQPQIFPGPNPEWHRNFTAQVQVTCTA
jgi:hypothetical protein